VAGRAARQRHLPAGDNRRGARRAHGRRRAPGADGEGRCRRQETLRGAVRLALAVLPSRRYIAPGALNEKNEVNAMARRSTRRGSARGAPRAPADPREAAIDALMAMLADRPFREIGLTD